MVIKLRTENAVTKRLNFAEQTSFVIDFDSQILVESDRKEAVSRIIPVASRKEAVSRIIPIASADS